MKGLMEKNPNQNKSHLTQHAVHVYDGIIEENNPMPGWWIWLFILTMIFGSLYWLHYQVGGAPTLTDEYNTAMLSYKNLVEKGASSSDTEESLSAYMKNEKSLLLGAAIFKEKCAMCHGENLEGKIGPNLTDQYWVNGKGTRLDLLEIIKKGSPAKGMPPWDGLLKPIEVKDVVSFVFSKIGSNPANPKAPDGILVK